MGNVLINVKISRVGSTKEPNDWPQRVSYIGGDTTHAPWWAELVQIHKLILSRWPVELLPFKALGLPFPIIVPSGAVHYSYQGALRRLENGTLEFKGVWSQHVVSRKTCWTCKRPDWVTEDVRVIANQQQQEQESAHGSDLDASVR